MASESLKISIIMNCYNGSEYLDVAIQSVIDQTYENWELIFWDNCSTDNSAEIFFSFNDERLCYFCADSHSSLGQARMMAVTKSIGSWIAFLDVDDEWLPDKLELQVRVATNGICNLGLVYSPMSAIKENEWHNRHLLLSKKIYPKRCLDGNLLNELALECFVPWPSALVKREAYVSVGGFNKNLIVAEDYDLIFKIAKNYVISCVPEVTCFYRLHSKNLSKRKIKETLDESLLVLSHGSFDRIYLWFAQIIWRSRAIYEYFKIADFRSMLLIFIGNPFVVLGILYLVYSKLRAK